MTYFRISFHCMMNTSGFVTFCPVESAPVNNLPVVSGVYPVNHTLDVIPCPRLFATVSDDDGVSLTVEWWSNATGDWIRMGYNLSVASGSNVSCLSGNLSGYDNMYNWSVNVSDGTDWTNHSFDFRTEECGGGSTVVGVVGCDRFALGLSIGLCLLVVGFVMFRRRRNGRK